MRESLKRFQKSLSEKDLDGALIAAPEALGSTNLRYLSGFTGSSAYLLITPDRAFILTDFRYLEQAAAECEGFEVVRHDRAVAGTVAQLCRQYHIHRMGWEPDKVPVALFEQWNSAVPVVWQPLQNLLERQRVIKDSEEIGHLREAARIAGQALMEILPSLPGRPERDVALDLEMAMRRRGAETLGFSTIVGSGERGALPHAHPTDRVIQAGELVTIDFGAQSNGYKSDETITVGIGVVPDALRTIWDVVAEAQKRGIAAVRPGNTSRDVDTVVREYIAEKGYGEYFGHGTGHGVGLDIHEDPFASPSPEQERVLEVGMTITVEPGIYIPGLGGARLEDTLVVTSEGHERLTIVPKHYQSLG